MSAEKIQKYLEILLDIQKERYVQNQLMDGLIKTRNSLGIPKKIQPPVQEQVRGDYGGNMILVGVISGLIIGIVSVIIFTNMAWDNMGIFAIVMGIFAGFIFGIGGGFLFGVLIGPAFAAGEKSREQSKANKQFNYNVQQYNIYINNDSQRVNYELQVRRKMDHEINLLNAQMRKSADFEKKLYEAGILDDKYHYNIVATASFYQYFKSHMTYSLGFDRSTGDIGAYRIYENEIRQNLIINKLDIVIQKLDEIISNQYVLFNCLNDANKKLDKLGRDIINASRDINSNINRNAAMQQYRDECNYNELRYMNWLQEMDLLRK